MDEASLVKALAGARYFADRAAFSLALDVLRMARAARECRHPGLPAAVADRRAVPLRRRLGAVHAGMVRAASAPIDTAMDLLAADDAAFGRRSQATRDKEGRATLDELARQLQRLGAQIADVADALGLTAARVRAQMISPGRAKPRS